MEESHLHIADLLVKASREGLTSQEDAELQAWLKKDPSHLELAAGLRDPALIRAELDSFAQVATEKILAKIEDSLWEGEVAGQGAHEDEDVFRGRRFPEGSIRVGQVGPVQVTEDAAGGGTDGGVVRAPARRWQTLAVAASVLALVGTMIFYLYPRGERNASIHEQVAAEVRPGSNKAVLTLADGDTVELDSASLQSLPAQGGVQLRLSAGGQLIYTHDGAASQTPPMSKPVAPVLAINKLSVPNAGRYSLVLPDGTHIWLNNTTTLTYPAAFDAQQRSVTLDGEAYFEVAQDKKRPFVVHVGASEVEVLGTSFSVKAYSGERGQRMVLMNGAIRVRKGAVVKILKPGQQAVTDEARAGIDVANDADLAGAIAWKEGLFHFDKDGIREVMAQLARWYDIEVVYEGDPKSEHQFSGDIERSLPLSNVLKDLEGNGFKFSLVGRRLTVSRSR